MAEQQLIGALEAGGTKMVCATGYADGTVLEREQIATTTPQETVVRGSACCAGGRCGASRLARYAGKCLRISSAPRPDGFDPMRG